MLYELRIYHIYPGRMNAINNRFKEHTLNLFKKHNIDTLDFLGDAGSNNTIYCILEAFQNFKKLELKMKPWEKD